MGYPSGIYEQGAKSFLAVKKERQKLFLRKETWGLSLSFIEKRRGHYFHFFRDQSIFMGIRDREICNGTTHYFGLLVERGHRSFPGPAFR